MTAGRVTRVELPPDDVLRLFREIIDLPAYEPLRDEDFVHEPRCDGGRDALRVRSHQTASPGLGLPPSRALAAAVELGVMTAVPYEHELYCVECSGRPLRRRSLRVSARRYYIEYFRSYALPTEPTIKEPTP